MNAKITLMGLLLVLLGTAGMTQSGPEGDKKSCTGKGCSAKAHGKGQGKKHHRKGQVAQGQNVTGQEARDDAKIAN